MRNIRTSIEQLLCRSCGSELYSADFLLENDTDGWFIADLSACGAKLVVVAERTLEEANNWSGAGPEMLEQRINALMGRNDLRWLRMLPRQVQELPGGGNAIFPKRFKTLPPTFECPCCGGGVADIFSKMTVDEFVSSGGTLEIIGDIGIIPIPV